MKCKFCGSERTTTTPMITNIPKNMKHLEYIKKAESRIFITCSKCHMTHSEERHVEYRRAM